MLDGVFSLPGWGLKLCCTLQWTLCLSNQLVFVTLDAFAGAFNMTTGPAHWELLQKARAVDNQLYIATCSPARDAGAGYTAWGHSMIVDPFAAIIAETEEKAGTVHAEIDFAQVDQRRQNMPLFNQKRFDLYALLDKTLE